MSEKPARTLRIASYNVHSGVGSDRRRDPERALAVIAEIDADIVALQEVAVSADADLPQLLRQRAGYAVVYAPTLQTRAGSFGNALLSRLPVAAQRAIDLSQARREPRAAIDVDLEIETGSLRVLATHLGLRAAERRAQLRTLLERMAEGTADVSLLLGDLNLFWPRGRDRRYLRRHFGTQPQAPATWPAPMPLLALDAIRCDPVSALHDLRAHRSATSRHASDHLPLVADIHLD